MHIIQENVAHLYQFKKFHENMASCKKAGSKSDTW